MGVTTNIRPVRFTVTFAETYPLDMVDGMLETDFIGLGKTYRLDDTHVLILRPFPHTYDAVRETLEEMAGVGALTFVEEFL